MTRDGFYLFAYGSLRSADSSRPARLLLDGCDPVAEATVSGILYDLGEYPALLLGGGDPVRGTVWRCPSERLEALDDYEGVADGLFRRVGLQVGEFPCWVYVAGPRLGPQLVPPRRKNNLEDSV